MSAEDEFLFNDEDGSDKAIGQEEEEFILAQEAKMFPVLYKQDLNGAEIHISLDFDWNCYHLSTTRYRASWWFGGLLRVNHVVGNNKCGTECLDIKTVKPDLSLYCEFNVSEPLEKRTISFDYEKFDKFIDTMRVFC
jgi:hypothetical protein